jgi:predicted RNA-binding protein
VLSEISLKKCNKIRKYRNAFAHPEDFLIVKQSSTKNVYTLKPKKVVPKDKENAYVALQYDLKTKLKTMAEESLEFAYNTIREQLEKLLL